MKIFFPSLLLAMSFSISGAHAHSYSNHAEQSCKDKITAHCQGPHEGVKAGAECEAAHYNENKAHGILSICQMVDTHSGHSHSSGRQACDAGRHGQNLDANCKFK